MVSDSATMEEDSTILAVLPLLPPFLKAAAVLAFFLGRLLSAGCMSGSFLRGIIGLQ